MPPAESIGSDNTEDHGMELRTLRYFLAAAREGNMTRAAEGIGCAFCLDGAFAAASCPDLKFIPLSSKKNKKCTPVEE